MEIFLYRQGAEHIEEGFTVEQLPDLLKTEGDIVWVDMESPTEADEQVLLDIFNFHPLTVEDCRENRQANNADSDSAPPRVSSIFCGTPNLRWFKDGWHGVR